MGGLEADETVAVEARIAEELLRLTRGRRVGSQVLPLPLQAMVAAMDRRFGARGAEYMGRAAGADRGGPGAA